MTGEQHLEEAARAMKRYIDENTCGFCKRKADGINRAIIGLRDVTGEAEELAKKIEERRELVAIDRNPMAMSPVPFPPIPKTPDYSEIRARLKARRAQKVIPQKSSEEVKDESFLDMIKNRPRVKDVLYLGEE